MMLTSAIGCLDRLENSAVMTLIGGQLRKRQPTPSLANNLAQALNLNQSEGKGKGRGKGPPKGQKQNKQSET